LRDGPGLFPLRGSRAVVTILPGSCNAPEASVQSVPVSQAGAYVAVDVTLLVQGWITAPGTNDGMALTAATGAATDIQFDSKENDQTGHAPSLEIMLVSGGAGVPGPVGAAGPAGSAGASGSPGAAGSAGLPGPRGLSGANGLSGPAGAQGSAGPQGFGGLQGSAGLAGPKGAVGPVGPGGLAGGIGPAGSPGLVYRGDYASVTNYSLGDVVLWQGASYASLFAGNYGNTPGFVASAWGVLTAQGPLGVAGPQGSSGLSGPQGVPGFVGPAGGQGLQGVAGPAGPVGTQGLTGASGFIGDRGPQGLQGIAGQAGAQGISGVEGAQGLSGPAGQQGLAGPVGLIFRGPYASIVNYGLGDGVLYGGAGYVSLVTGNHGNSPDLSPLQWTEFASGGAGPAGAAGAIGPIGGNGVAGLNGAVGPAGPAGAVGPQGPPVANYTGNYASTGNYALNDAVEYGGSTYISLMGANHGNAPDQSPSWWALLVARGEAGPVGIAGAVGAVGPAGGAGLTGPAGPQGAPIQFTGYWAVARQYGVGDTTALSGSSYIALAANLGRQPDLSPQYWGVLAQAGVGSAGAMGPAGPQGGMGYPGPAGVAGSAGPTGAAGPVGVAGTAGAAGPLGPAGVQGAMGIAGLAYRGGYLSSTNYGLNDTVAYQGSSFISLAASNAGQTPGLSPAFWGVLAAQGTPGTVGARFRGTWGAGVPYQGSDAVAFGGSTYLAQAANSGQEPDLDPSTWAVMAVAGVAGVAGPSGPSGAAASVSVGVVSTGSAGSLASVTNTGTTSSAVLNFVIPQGVAGTGGAGGGGSGSSSGALPVSAFHAVSFSLSFYSMSGATASATETANVLTWIPNACTATTLEIYSQQANAI